MLHHPNTVPALIVAIALLTGCADKTPEERIDSAKAALAAFDFKSADIELKTVLQGAPSNSQARLLLGQSLMAQERWADSEKELRKALEMGAMPEQVLPDLARALVRQGRYQDVIDLQIPAHGLGSLALSSIEAERANAFLALKKVPEATRTIAAGEKLLASVGTPRPPVALLLAKARLALAERQSDKAVELLESTLKQDEKNSEALDLMAQLLINDSKLDEALDIYSRIIAINPRHFSAHLSAAGLHQRKGDLAASEKSVAAAEAIARNAPMVRFARASLEFSRGNARKAHEAIIDVLKARPDHLPSRLIAASASLELGHFEQSLKHAEYVLAQQPANLMAARVLAASQLKSNDPVAALKTLNPLLREHADDAAILTLAGEALIQTRDYGKAMSMLEKAARLAPNNPHIHNQMAVSHLYQGETELAAIQLEQASRFSKTPGQADIALVLLKLNKQEFDSAMLLIERIEKKLGNSPLPHNLRAAVFLGQNKYAAARQSLEKALEIDPKFFAAAATLASLDLKDNDDKAARRRFENILNNDPSSVPAMLALAELEQKAGNDEASLNWLRKAVKRNSKFVQPHQRLISYYLANKQNGKALAQAREALQQNPESPAALKLMGATQLATGDVDAALATFKQIVSKHGGTADAYYQLAKAQVVARDLNGARGNLKQALALRTDFLPAQEALLRIEMGQGKTAEALALARQMQAQAPKSAVGFEREGDILLASRRPAQAIPFFQQAIERGSGMSARIKLLQASELKGDYRNLESLLSDWLKAHSSDQTLRRYAAEYFTRQGRNQEAIALYETLQKQTPRDATILNNMAVLYHRLKDYRALETAEQALARMPESASIQDTLGWILLEHGQTSRALDLLRSATQKSPKSATLRYHLAVALVRSGNKKEARKELETILSSKQKFPELADAQSLLNSL